MEFNHKVKFSLLLSLINFTCLLLWFIFYSKFKEIVVKENEDFLIIIGLVSTFLLVLLVIKIFPQKLENILSDTKKIVFLILPSAFLLPLSIFIWIDLFSR